MLLALSVRCWHNLFFLYLWEDTLTVFLDDFSHGWGGSHSVMITVGVWSTDKIVNVFFRIGFDWNARMNSIKSDIVDD